MADPETDEVCDRWLRNLGYSGICEIEMKRDSRDGRVKLIEANPRLTGGGDAAPYAGVDVCWLHYLDLIGKPVTPVAGTGETSGMSYSSVRPQCRYRVPESRTDLLAGRTAFLQASSTFYDFDRR